MHRCESSISGSKFWNVVDEHAPPWIRIAIGPVPRSLATLSSGARRVRIRAFMKHRMSEHLEIRIS
jgi:hypothetical protein